MYGYIYKTTNTVTGKIYIGQKKAKAFLGESYLGSGKKLGESVRKQGKEAFKVELLEWCNSLEELNEKEIYWIAHYKSCDKTIGYNISAGGNVPCMEGENNPFFFGKHHTQESRGKMRRHHHQLKGESHPNYGNHLSEEAKQRISRANKGREKTEEEKKKRSETYKRHADERGGGWWITGEHRDRLSAAQKELWTKERREQSSAKFTNLWQDEDYRKKHIEGMIGKRRPRGPGKTHNIGKHWYNDGKIQLFASECPEGFFPGMLKKHKASN